MILSGATATLGSVTSPSHPFVVFFRFIFWTPSSESREVERLRERSGIFREIKAECSGGTTESKRLVEKVKLATELRK